MYLSRGCDYERRVKEKVKKKQKSRRERREKNNMRAWGRRIEGCELRGRQQGRRNPIYLIWRHFRGCLGMSLFLSMSIQWGFHETERISPQSKYTRTLRFLDKTNFDFIHSSYDKTFLYAFYLTWLFYLWVESCNLILAYYRPDYFFLILHTSGAKIIQNFLDFKN